MLSLVFRRMLAYVFWGKKTQMVTVKPICFSHYDQFAV